MERKGRFGIGSREKRERGFRGNRGAYEDDSEDVFKIGQTVNLATNVLPTTTTIQYTLDQFNK